MCKLAMQCDSVNGILLAFFRVSGAAVLFWLISPLVPREKIASRDWPALLGMSICGMLVNQFLYVLGIQYTSPSNACVIGSTTPVMTFVLSVIFLHHKVTRRRIVGFLLATIGALFLILASVSGGIGGSSLGDILCLVSQFSAACYFVFFGGVLRRYHPITIMKWLFLFAALISLLPMWDALCHLSLIHLQFREIFAITYVIIGGSFFSYLLLMVGQRRLDPPTVAAYNYVQPIIAAVIGIYLGLDLLSWQKCCAFLLIAGGVAFISVRDANDIC